MSDQRPSDSVRVTDPLLDAPDGAVVTFPNGVVYERHGDRWEPQNDRCTGLTAKWCPNHGDCRCPGDEPGDDLLCPLHTPHSSHAEGAGIDGAGQVGP